jgi:hypothetical protein
MFTVILVMGYDPPILRIFREDVWPGKKVQGSG